MSDEHNIKSCPSCGERQLEVYSFGQDGKGSFEETHGVRCLNCTIEKASVNEWNNAYCWKEIENLEEKVSGLQAQIGELVDALEEVEMCYSHLEAETDSELREEVKDPITIPWIHKHCNEELERVRKVLDKYVPNRFEEADPAKVREGAQKAVTEFKDALINMGKGDA